MADATDCSICQESVGAVDGDIAVLPCGHPFCLSCISAWLEVVVRQGDAARIACPMCKTKCGPKPVRAFIRLPSKAALLERAREQLIAEAQRAAGSGGAGGEGEAGGAAGAPDGGGTGAGATTTALSAPGWYLQAVQSRAQLSASEARRQAAEQEASTAMAHAADWRERCNTAKMRMGELTEELKRQRTLNRENVDRLHAAEAKLGTAEAQRDLLSAQVAARPFLDAGDAAGLELELRRQLSSAAAAAASAGQWPQHAGGVALIPEAAALAVLSAALSSSHEAFSGARRAQERHELAARKLAAADKWGAELEGEVALLRQQVARLSHRRGAAAAEAGAAGGRRAPSDAAASAAAAKEAPPPGLRSRNATAYDAAEEFLDGLLPLPAPAVGDDAYDSDGQLDDDDDDDSSGAAGGASQAPQARRRPAAASVAPAGWHAGSSAAAAGAPSRASRAVTAASAWPSRASQQLQLPLQPRQQPPSGASSSSSSSRASAAALYIEGDCGGLALAAAPLPPARTAAAAAGGGARGGGPTTFGGSGGGAGGGGGLQGPSGMGSSRQLSAGVAGPRGAIPPHASAAAVLQPPAEARPPLQRHHSAAVGEPPAAAKRQRLLGGLASGGLAPMQAAPAPVAFDYSTQTQLESQPQRRAAAAAAAGGPPLPARPTDSEVRRLAVAAHTQSSSAALATITSALANPRLSELESATFRRQAASVSLAARLAKPLGGSGGGGSGGSGGGVAGSLPAAAAARPVTALRSSVFDTAALQRPPPGVQRQEPPPGAGASQQTVPSRRPQDEDFYIDLMDDE